MGWWGAAVDELGEVSQTFGRFSPDGKWVSLVSAGGGTSQIWTAAWDEATGTIKKPYPLTSVSTEADGAEWSPDSQRLLFVSSVYPECSVKGGGKTNTGVLRSAQNDNPKTNDNLKTYEAATWAEEDACNKAKDEAAAESKVKAQVWDSLLYRHWDQYTGKKRSHVLVVSRANGEEVRDLTPASAVGDAEVPTFSLGGPIGYAWAPDSKEIAYVAKLDKVPAASTNNDVFTLRLDEPGAKAVKVSTSLGSDDGPRYSADGKWLAFRSQARAGYESDRFRLMLFDREKKTIRDVMPKWDRWVDEMAWAPNSEAIYFVSGSSGQSQIYNVALIGEWPSEDIAGADFGNVTGEMSAEFSELAFSSDGKWLVASGMRANSPTDLYRFPVWNLPPEELHGVSPIEEWQIRSGAAMSGAKAVLTDVAKLTKLNDSLKAQLDLSPKEPYHLESFSFSGAGGTKVEGFMMPPPNFDPAKKYPLKFLIHGGPQGAWGDAGSYRWNAELMAASGYVVVMVNPRGSTGYGQAFIDGVNGDWGGKAYVDLMKGLDAAEVAYPFIDKDRECALGASYGGYMADWILTHTNRFKCIVTHDGMFDPVSAYGATEEMWFNEWEFRRGPATGAAAWDKEPASPWRYQGLPAEQDPFRKWSPMLHIKDAKTPTLVVHSQRDYRLDVSQGFQLFTALQRLGVPSKFLYFPDEGHWVLKPQNSQL